MGGNIVDSPAGVSWRAGTLLGPEGTARVVVFFGSGFRPETHTADREVGFGGSLWWSGVRWGVCELDSGCEHLVIIRLLLCSVFE